MSDDYLRVRLEALGAGPPTDDWNDALRRAARLRKRRTRVIALAAVAAVLIAVPAVAVAVDAIDFWSAEPAPERVKLVFDALEKGEPAHLPRPGVDASEARKIMTREFKYETWTLYVGPTKAGGFCTFTVGEYGTGGAGCTKRGVPLKASGTFVDELSPAVISGSATHKGGAYVEVVLDGAPPVRAGLVWVSEPIDAAFFMAEVPEWGSVRAVVLRAADGKELARQDF